MHISLEELLAVESSSTSAFLETVFELYEQKKLFAIMRPDTANAAVARKARAVMIPKNRPNGWFCGKHVPSTSDAPAQIVFSSGTEGPPKAIVLSHHNLADAVERLNKVMGVTSEIREYIGVPVTYAFGLGRARAVAAAGGASYIPERFHPGEIRSMLEQGEINAISAVPSLWRIVLKSRDIIAPVADRVRWIEIGSQYMSVEEKKEMKALFPKARIIQQYGLTEASRTTFLDVSAAPDTDLDSVGSPIGDVELRIDDAGSICIRGPHVALGLLGEDGQMTPLTDRDGWLVTKDRGSLHDRTLYFHGRIDEQINISGLKISADQIENEISEKYPEYSGTFAISSIDDSLRGHAVLLAIEKVSHSAQTALEAAALAALEKHGVTGGDNLHVWLTNVLPRTGTGKIQRTSLRKDYSKNQSKNQAYNNSSKNIEKKSSWRQKRNSTVREVFTFHFPNSEINSDTSFEILGGDSLSYLSVALDLEKVIGDLPEDWPSQTIGSLEKIDVSKYSFWGWIDSPTFFRAAAIILVVAGHFEALNYGGTAVIALFFIAGSNFGALTLPATLHQNSVAPVFKLLFRIMAITWISMIVNYLVTGYGDPLSFLMFTNWISTQYDGAVWFVEVYVQIILVLTLLLMIKPVQVIMEKEPFKAFFCLSILGVLVMYVSENVFDTNHLYRRLPHLLAWVFLCGALSHFSRDRVEKAICISVFMLGWWIYGDFSIRFVIFVVPFMVVFGSFLAPRFIIPTLRTVASASLIIYVSHFQFRELLNMAGISGNAVFNVIFAVIGGALLWKIYLYFDNWISARMSRIL